MLRLDLDTFKLVESVDLVGVFKVVVPFSELGTFQLDNHGLVGDEAELKKGIQLD